MSSASVTSSKRGNNSADLQQELDSVRAMNKSLTTYLEYLVTFKKNLHDVNKNCHELNQLNTQWIEALDTIEKQKRIQNS